ncbi:response regulator, partial [Streptococcus suis]
MRILLAEDDADTAAQVAAGLRAIGHVVAVHGDGAAAREAGLTEPFDLAILDRMLPAADGIAILEAWRAAGIRMPVIMLTARGSIADRVTSLDAGADD